MVSLRKGGVVLALFTGEAAQGQVIAIGLTLSMEAIAGIRERLSSEAEVEMDEHDGLEFRDPNQIIWQISTPGSEFRT